MVECQFPNSVGVKRKVFYPQSARNYRTDLTLGEVGLWEAFLKVLLFAGRLEAAVESVSRGQLEAPKVFHAFQKGINSVCSQEKDPW